MKKSTKLLSVILAVVMIFSTMSVMAFAAKTNYSSGEELTALDAYSPDGAVTRLSTEERMSVVFDFLDVTLAAANINMGEVLASAPLSSTSTFARLMLFAEPSTTLSLFLTAELLSFSAACSA